VIISASLGIIVHFLEINKLQGIGGFFFYTFFVHSSLFTRLFWCLYGSVISGSNGALRIYYKISNYKCFSGNYRAFFKINKYKYILGAFYTICAIIVVFLRKRHLWNIVLFI
jgi:hypothetical protein